MSQSRLLVAAVVAFVLAAYGATLYVLARRHRGNVGWWLLTGELACAFWRTLSWFLLVLDNVRGPAIYDHIPPQGWSILASAVVEAVLLFWLSLWMLSGDVSGAHAPNKGGWQ